MAAVQSVRYKRRNFFVKQWFQVGFALYPGLFLSIFLVVGGFYLHSDIKQSLEFYLYLPHGGLQNPWEVVGPAVLRVAGVGGGAFLCALGLWGWARFSRLHGDLQALATWVGSLDADAGPLELPRLRDAEVRSLGEGLAGAVSNVRAWEAEAAQGRDRVSAAIRGIADAPEQDLPRRVAELRLLWRAFSGKLSAIRIEEDLG